METLSNSLLTVEQVARDLGISPATVYKAVREGRLFSVRVLGRVLIRREDAARFQPASHGGARPNAGNRKEKSEGRRLKNSRPVSQTGNDPKQKSSSLFGRKTAPKMPPDVMTIGDISVTNTTDWDALNKRRVDLLKKRIAQGLSPEEEGLVAELTRQMDDYVQLVAPLPFSRLDGADS